MNRADAIVIEALKPGEVDPKREYTIVNEKGRSQYPLADEGWRISSATPSRFVMSRAKPDNPPKLEPEPVAAKVKPDEPRPTLKLWPTRPRGDS